MKRMILILAGLLVVSCAGMKVVNPNDRNENEGTLALDASGGSFKLVKTYTCKLESMGNRFSAVGKSEASARKEVVARCRDRTALSFCQDDKVVCVKN